MKKPYHVLSRCLLYDGHGFRELRRDADGEYWDVSPDDETAKKDWGDEQGFEKAQMIERLDLGMAMSLYNGMREILVSPMAAFPPIEEWSPELLRRQLNLICGDELVQASSLTTDQLIKEVKDRGLQLMDGQSDEQLQDEIAGRGLHIEKTLREASDLELLEELSRREPSKLVINYLEDMFERSRDGS